MAFFSLAVLRLRRGHITSVSRIKEDPMKLLSSFLIIVSTITLISCVSTGDSSRLSEVKAELYCIGYKEGVDWQQIRGALGDAQINPIPQKGSETKNSRIYTENRVIFYTDLKRLDEGGRTSYKEVVTGIDICKKK
jgi:hypothetical protein